MSDSQRLPRKVLHVLNSSAGGAALSTLALIDAFRAHGIEAVAVSHDAGSPAEREALRDATAGNVAFTPLYWWNKKIRNPLWKRPLSEARQILRTGWGRSSSRIVAEMAAKHGVDLIHTNTLTTPEGGIAARSLGLPHVWHCRELVGPGSPYPLARSGQRLGRYLAAHCSKLIPNSQATAAQLAPWVPADLIEIVYNGIDLSHFTPRERPPREPLVVGMVGNLTSQIKKHPLLVEAAGRVDRSLPIEWRIYGRDPSQSGRVRGDAYLDRLHDRLAELKLTDRFKFPGLVPSPAAIMDELDLLVHPADGESFGRIVVEAMAAGLPVVGVKGGGVGEIVIHEQTGLLAPIDDPAALAAHVETLARDAQLRARLGQAGRQRAAECYSIESCVSHMLQVYQQALARPLTGSTESRDRSRGLNA